MKLLKTLIVILFLLSPPAFAVDQVSTPQPVEGEIQESSPETGETNSQEMINSEESGDADLPEGLEIDPGGNVEESESIYSLNINLPQELVGSELSIQDQVGTNLKQMTVGPTGQVSYSFMTPQSLNVTVQGAIKGEEDKDEGTVPITTAIVLALFCIMVVALLSFLGGRISALHVLKDLRDYIYDKNLD